MPIKQISVFIENRPGSLSAVANVLREHNIDLRALSLADVQDYGILRIIVDDVYAATTVLRDAGYVFKITPMLAVVLKDQAGSLADALEVLGSHNINIEYLYAFAGREQDRAYVALRLDDGEMDKAAAILQEAGFPTISSDGENGKILW